MTAYSGAGTYAIIILIKLRINPNTWVEYVGLPVCNIGISEILNLIILVVIFLQFRKF